MNKKLLMSILSVAIMVFLAGCTKGTSQATPDVPSQGVESSSSSIESSAGNFVNDATPTADQVIPNVS